MFHSAEIRWFFRGAPDASIVAWFGQSSLATEEEPRIDTYLVLPACTSAGVKVRQGHLEVKALTSAPQKVTYDNGISGRRASWVKWSSGIAGAPLLTERNGPEQWLQVEKSRSQRLFSVADSVQERPPSEWLSGPGCFMELGRVRVPADDDNWDAAARWWTVCLEAFGEQGEVGQTLDRVAGSSKLAGIANSLPEDSSMSYPEWLLAVTA